MSKEVRHIITGLNITVCILVTELLIRYVFGDVGGIRLVIVALAVAICLFKALTDTEGYFIKRGVKNRNEKKTRRFERTCGEDVVPGIPWYKMRYTKTGEGNGNL